MSVVLVYEVIRSQTNSCRARPWQNMDDKGAFHPRIGQQVGPKNSVRGDQLLLINTHKCFCDSRDESPRDLLLDGYRGLTLPGEILLSLSFGFFLRHLHAAEQCEGKRHCNQ